MRVYSTILLCLITVLLHGQESITKNLPLQINSNYNIYYFNEDKYFFAFHSSLFQETQISKYASSKDYFYQKGIFSGLNQIYLGIEANKTVAPKCYLGINTGIKILSDTRYNLLDARLNFVHKGKIHSIQFLKEIGLDFTQSKITKITQNSFQVVSHLNTVIDLGITLAYKFNIKQFPIRIMVNGKFYFVNENTDESSKEFSKRFVDFSELKLSTNTLILKKINIGIFGKLSNKYSVSLTNKGDVNITTFTPILGWEINYFLGKPSSDGNYSYIF